MNAYLISPGPTKRNSVAAARRGSKTRDGLDTVWFFFAFPTTLFPSWMDWEFSSVSADSPTVEILRIQPKSCKAEFQLGISGKTRRHMMTMS